MTLHFFLDLQRPKQGEFPIVCRITNNGWPADTDSLVN